MFQCIFLAIHERSKSSLCLASVCISFTAAGCLWTGFLFEERVKKIARIGKGRNREPVHRLCRRISSVDRALDCLVGGDGFDSRGRTDTQALEIIDKWRCYLSPANDQGRVVRSCVKITQGLCEIWTRIWELKKQIPFNSLCLQFDDWIL